MIKAISTQVLQTKQMERAILILLMDIDKSPPKKSRPEIKELLYQ